MRKNDWELEHPEITCIERTGYPSTMQDRDDEDEEGFEEEEEIDYDRAYQEQMESILGMD